MSRDIHLESDIIGGEERKKKKKKERKEKKEKEKSQETKLTASFPAQASRTPDFSFRAGEGLEVGAGNGHYSFSAVCGAEDA